MIFMSAYENDNRKATVYDDMEGYMIELFKDSKRVKTLQISTLAVAEDVAEDWVLGAEKQ